MRFEIETLEDPTATVPGDSDSVAKFGEVGGRLFGANTGGGLFGANTGGGLFGAANTGGGLFGAQNTGGGLFGAANTGGGVLPIPNLFKGRPTTWGGQEYHTDL